MKSAERTAKLRLISLTTVYIILCRVHLPNKKKLPNHSQNIGAGKSWGKHAGHVENPTAENRLHLTAFRERLKFRIRSFQLVAIVGPLEQAVERRALLFPSLSHLAHLSADEREGDRRLGDSENRITPLCVIVAIG